MYILGHIMIKVNILRIFMGLVIIFCLQSLKKKHEMFQILHLQTYKNYISVKGL